MELEPHKDIWNGNNTRFMLSKPWVPHLLSHVQDTATDLMKPYFFRNYVLQFEHNKKKSSLRQITLNQSLNKTMWEDGPIVKI